MQARVTDAVKAQVDFALKITGDPLASFLRDAIDAHSKKIIQEQTTGEST